MKTLADIPVNQIANLRKLAESLPPAEESKQQEVRGQRSEVSRPKGQGKWDPGGLIIPQWLGYYGVEFSEKVDGDRTIYRLARCPFDESHGRNEASFIQDSSGVVSFQCFHDSCKGRTFKEAKQIISSDDNLAQFCRNYDPDKAKGQGGDKPARDAEQGGKLPDEIPPGMSFSKSGKPLFNPAAMANWLEAEFRPLLYEGKTYTGFYYKYEGGVWRFFAIEEVRKRCREVLGDFARPEWITKAVGVLDDQIFLRPDQYECDPMLLNVGNGMLKIPELELSPHAPEYYSRAQMPVSFNPEARYRLWEDSLVEIFEDDFNKITCLQEFFGYCLWPRIMFPAALFCIGGGGNGKGTVEFILHNMLGKANVSHISLARMEKPFGPIELRDKLLNSCSETETRPLEVTNFKAISAGDEIQADVKFGKDVKFTPIAKHMISMNAFPGVKDKSGGFYRRLIVMEFNQTFSGEKDNKGLKQELLKELDGIFLWALKGLQRVIERKDIYIPESCEAAKERFRMKNNNVLLWCEERCDLGDDYWAHPPKLYDDYEDWCKSSRQSGVLGRTNFYEQLHLNFGVTRRRPHDSTTQLFKGIKLHGQLSAA